MKRRVVVSGLGTLNAVGNSVEESWANMTAGKTGITGITLFKSDDLASRIAGEVKNFDPTIYMDGREARKLDRYSQFAIAAAVQAMEDSGLLKYPYDPTKVGVISGVGIGGMETFYEEAQNLLEKGPRRISPYFIPKMICNIAAAHISIRFNLQAINFNCVSACASANHAMGMALRTIQYGDADIILVVGAEAALTRLSVAGFCSLKALSTFNEDPAKACRPFDKNRDGFVMAEGVGVLVLESLEHALARQAKIYAEIAGFGATGDAFHITAPRDDGEGGARAIRMALHDAGLAPEDVQYFNAHGTSTPLNDKIETLSIKHVFGAHAKKLKISSTKSMVGHTLGAAAGIEGMVCCKTIETGTIHPTINYETPDSDCDLDYVPNVAEKMDVKVALSNSLGFGGQNSVIIFKKYE